MTSLVAKSLLAALLITVGCNHDQGGNSSVAAAADNAKGRRAERQQPRAEADAAASNDNRGRSGADESCDAPEVPRATLNLERCQASGDCLVDPSGKNVGYLADRFTPLSERLPPEILAVTDPGYTDQDHKVVSKGVVYGINPNGGGYGVHFAPPGEGNIARFGYGDGWQSSIRDAFHDNDWNPTQAGAGWSAGTKARIEKIAGGKGFSIKRHNMPNFINSRKDFVQNDEIAERSGRDFTARRPNDKDEDACNESSIDEEVRSEFDFVGEVQDVADLIGSKIPAFRFLNHIEYTRNPQSVMQFNRPADPAKRNKWILEKARMNISPYAYDEDNAVITDLSLSVYSWGLRLKENSRFKYLGVKKSGQTKWSFSTLKPDGHERSRTNLVFARRDKAHIAKQFVSGKPTGLSSGEKDSDILPYALLSDGENPKTAKAIALYYPVESPTNRYQTIGVKDDKVVYAENRQLVSQMVGIAIPMSTSRDQMGYNLVARVYSNGLLEPRRTPHGVREAFRSEVYVFYGTPDEIEAEIEKLEKSGKFHGVDGQR